MQDFVLGRRPAPSLLDYKTELSSLNSLQREIESKEANAAIGAISLNNEHIKNGIIKALNIIKKKLCQNLHEQAKSELESISEKINNQ